MEKSYDNGQFILIKKDKNGKEICVNVLSDKQSLKKKCHHHNSLCLNRFGALLQLAKVNVIQALVTIIQVPSVLIRAFPTEIIR
jgi:hypothetical protein